MGGGAWVYGWWLGGRPICVAAWGGVARFYHFVILVFQQLCIYLDDFVSNGLRLHSTLILFKGAIALKNYELRKNTLSAIIVNVSIYKNQFKFNTYLLATII